MFDHPFQESEALMRYHFTHLAGTALVLGCCFALAGCARAPSETPTAQRPPVTVSYPVEREVTESATFTARTAAVDSVELRARVSGYLDKVNFKEGGAGQERGRALRDRPAHLPGGRGPVRTGDGYDCRDGPEGAPHNCTRPLFVHCFAPICFGVPHRRVQSPVRLPDAKLAIFEKR
jgi:hypothetical protein